MAIIWYHLWLSSICLSYCVTGLVSIFLVMYIGSNITSQLTSLFSINIVVYPCESSHSMILSILPSIIFRSDVIDYLSLWPACQTRSIWYVRSYLSFCAHSNSVQCPLGLLMEKLGWLFEILCVQRPIRIESISYPSRHGRCTCVSITAMVLMITPFGPSHI